MAASVVPETDSIRRAVLLLNAVDPGRFPRLLSRLLQRLHLKAETSFSEEEEEKLQIAFSLEKQDLHLVLEAISFILEQAVYHNLKPASLQQQLQSIHLDQDKAEAFASAWAAAGQETIEKFRQRVLTPQKLETIGWQLDLQMSTSVQAKLKSPRAVLELGMNNEDSKEVCWNQSPMEGVASPMEILRTHLGMVLGTLLQVMLLGKTTGLYGLWRCLSTSACQHIWVL
ncbi:COMM domain-containing protein 10 isoform X1 [Excalfactoria chinensis]|uniref:COMM domain-containing protein 10 isoform X1 n=1 Tax=Excalfactoria chinensis TaxID=46218 RepID=UPI003B3A7586